MVAASRMEIGVNLPGRTSETMFKNVYSSGFLQDLSRRKRWLIVFLAVFVLSGCSRGAYRQWADRDAYCLLKTRQFDSRWEVPSRVVEPDPRSRLADVQDPDCGLVPPDDPASHQYMEAPYHSKKQVRYWDNRGEADAIDSQRWLEYLPYDEDGVLVLDTDLTIGLSLLHSREFQTQVEQLYRQALGLSAARFEYDLNWFGGTSGSFNANDDGFDANRTLAHSDRLGFSRNFATGGQLAVSLLNSFTWQLGGGGHSNFSAGNLAFNLTQPLLRGAFRHVRTEAMTQSERNLLYAVRDFARFRRQFYLETVSGYLSLLNQVQSVRIEERNLRLLVLNRDEHEILLKQGQVAPNQVDQVFQSYQEGRISLINRQQGLQAAMDQFKFRLGLPARIDIQLDEAILDPFQLNSPAIQQLQDDVKVLEESLIQYLPPDETAPEEFLEKAELEMESLALRWAELKPSVEDELNQWRDCSSDPVDFPTRFRWPRPVQFQAV